MILDSGRREDARHCDNRKEAEDLPGMIPTATAKARKDVTAKSRKKVGKDIDGFI